MEYEPSWKSLPQTWNRLKEPAREHRQKPTAAEARLWDNLRGGKVDGLRFRRQHAIGPYIADFYCAAARLVIEVDGPVHEAQVEEDATRTDFLEARGLRVVRFGNSEVLDNISGVVQAIRECVAASRLSSGGRQADSLCEHGSVD